MIQVIEIVKVLFFLFISLVFCRLILRSWPSITILERINYVNDVLEMDTFQCEMCSLVNKKESHLNAWIKSDYLSIKYYCSYVNGEKRETLDILPNGILYRGLIIQFTDGIAVNAGGLGQVSPVDHKVRFYGGELKGKIMKIIQEVSGATTY